MSDRRKARRLFEEAVEAVDESDVRRAIGSGSRKAEELRGAAAGWIARLGRQMLLFAAMLRLRDVRAEAGETDRLSAG